MIDVLIVDDSPVARQLLEHILSSDPELRVVGTAADGEEALKFVAWRKPQVITMDIEMPNMDWFEASRRIMATKPVPIVVITASYNPAMVNKAFAAVQAGALAILEKPYGVNHPDYSRLAAEIIRTVKLMSEIKLVRRSRMASPPPVVDRAPPRVVEIVAIGASTGGPQALEAILSGLPKNYGIPLVIVQHIALGFVQGFVDWLNLTSGPRVAMARAGEQILAGRAYVAPSGFQMGVELNRTISLKKDLEKSVFCPSVAHLFQSVIATFGKQAVGVLLTGMGDDGAKALKLMRTRGAITVAQDEASSVVYGMPAEAVKLDAAEYVLPPKQITGLLAGFSRG